MPKVVIPTPLRQYAGKQEVIEVKAATVGELLQQLVTRHGDLRRHLYTDDGKLRSFVNVYVNDEDIRYLQKEQTAVKDSDVVSIVPSIAGGRGLALFNAEPPGPRLGDSHTRWPVPFGSAQGRPPGSAGSPEKYLAQPSGPRRWVRGKEQ